MHNAKDVCCAFTRSAVHFAMHNMHDMHNMQNIYNICTICRIWKICRICTVPICSLRCSVKSGGKFWHRSQCGRLEPTFSTLAGVFFRCTRWVGESSANSFSLKTCLRFLSGLSTLYLQVFLLCIFLLFSHGWQQCRGWLMITSWILFWGSSWMARKKKKWN